MQKPILGLAAAAVAAATGAVLLVHYTHEPASHPQEYLVVNNDKPDDQQTDGLDDLEEPNIEGPPPTSARDFVEDSTPCPGTAPEHPAPNEDGPAAHGQGWTSYNPGN
ncbi:hypothetical protein [Nocardia africana]|uniref:Secreted protein n=1 Tax=Nocardia africana TaxID=134964 RepID=A0A378WX13_9NOCA|nr:hypothetical protein [Nocardia africana]MCC3313664.1 hypothetical protein [Nocardia africana]SUA44954.1 Uncharacterised protein [Nocardia africana]